MTWLAVIAVGIVVIGLAGMFHLSAVLSWEDRKTQGLGYYGLPPADRERFRRALKRHAVLLFPMIHLLSRLSHFTFARSSFQHRGIAGPKGTCNPESFERGERYEPRPEDVFVATQMKCGTTWMLHAVYQVLLRGEGDLVESGSTLHAVCPWLEARKTVPMDAAPLVGKERPSRVIKTHFPVSHCPLGPAARYIYVARHPVSCFASCADFIAANTGSFVPPLEAIEEWFCSEQRMWWGTWPAHVQGWWELARDRTNVLFVHFEDMKRDLAAVVRDVVRFLDIPPLTDDQLRRVLYQCSFEYMQEHKWTFEMHPPHILAVDAELFVRGTADRYRDVPVAMRRRLAEWCSEAMRGGSFPLEQVYPDVTGTSGGL